jgi:hypothetical protein
VVNLLPDIVLEASIIQLPLVPFELVEANLILFVIDQGDIAVLEILNLFVHLFWSVFVTTSSILLLSSLHKIFEGLSIEFLEVTFIPILWIQARNSFL